MAAHIGVLVLPVAIIRPDAIPDPVLVLLWTLALLSCASETSTTVKRPPAPATVLPAALAALSQCAVLWASALEHALTRRPVPAPQAALGAAVFLGGIALRRASIRRLGERFLDEVSLLPGHRLETTGLYGVLRHPSEMGLLCVGLGATILLDSACAALLWVSAVVPCAVARARLEDQMLGIRFGPHFTAYCRRVGALIPKWPSRC